MSFDRPSTAPDDGASADDARVPAKDGLDTLDDAEVTPEVVGTATDDGDDGQYGAGDETDDTGVLYEDQVEPEYGILGFTLRELIIVGAWLVGFLVSFFPVGPIGDTIWTTGIHWILMMGVPTAAVFLVVLRRFSPDGIRRVGSLGIDQFASVAASVAALSWAQVLWQQVAGTIATGAVLIGWVAVVGLLAMLALVTVTVFGPLVPRLREDFHGRLETLAHRNANPVRPVISRPRPERAPAPAPDLGSRSGETAAAASTDDSASHDAEPRVETALTMVIPDAHSAVDAQDQASPARAPRPDANSAPEPAPAEPVLAQATSAEPNPAETDPAKPAHEGIASEDDDSIEVLYNTAAVEALQEIFAADEATNPRRPVEHNTAPDGVPGSVAVPDATDIQADAAAANAPDEETHALRGSRVEQPAVAEPFWILAPTERDVLDEHGEPLFRIGPSAWALAIEDRGGAFVVRHEDGRIGYLHDISDITKG